MIEQVIEQIKFTLTDNRVNYQKVIDDFGQVRAYEERQSGKLFDFNAHLKGLIYAQLSNQRPWGPIAYNRETIDQIFCGYDIDALKAKNPKELEHQVISIKCGNRKIAAQMNSLHWNIGLFEEIASKYGSMDSYVTSNTPEAIAKEFGSGKRFKLREIGFTLALEYLRNVGVNAIKPDLHICRLIGPKRLGFIDKDPSPENAFRCLMNLEDQVSDSAIYIDNLLWLFAAKDYGNICTANPKCDRCSVCLCVRHPSNKRM